MYGGFGNHHIPTYDENHSQVIGYPPEKTPFHRAQSISNRPSAKTIYQQRKAYSQKLNSTDNIIQHHVEHLITCDHDLNDRSTVEHCIQKLRKLHAEGKIWGQDIFLHLSATSFKMADLETKDDLEHFPIDAIQDSQAILNRCAYSSILAVTISIKHTMKSSIYLFQCDEVSADLIQNDMEKIIRRKKESGKEDMPRNTTESTIPQYLQAPYTKSPIPLPIPQRLPLPNSGNNVQPATLEHERWARPPSRTSSDNGSKLSNNQEDLKLQRSKEIFNHAIADIELFMDKIHRAIESNPQLKKKKKSKRIKEILPPETDYVDCLKKIKYAFNLLSMLESQLTRPSAADLVHSMFQSLQFILENAPKQNLAKDVIIPFLIPPAISFFTSNLSTEEDKLWHALGDAWCVPRSEWPGGEKMEGYTPTFSDGWVIPPQPSQQPPPANQDLSNEGECPTEQMGNRTWQDRETFERSQMFAKAIYDFKKRNYQELTVTAGDVLEVVEATKQWWKVKDSNGSVGYVPQNIMEFLQQEETVSLHNDSDRGLQYLPKAHSPQLTERSTATEVTAWLQDKGFSNITVASLGVLSGSQLMSLTEQELKMIAMNEGHLVYSEIHRSGMWPSRPTTPAWKTNH